MAEALKSYGVRESTLVSCGSELAAEEIRICGYTVVPGVLSEPELEAVRRKLDDLYKIQIKEIGGEQRLSEINDLNIVRLPLTYDDLFLHVATNRIALAIIGELLGDYFILMQQNGIITLPERPNYQASWHRDLSYQHFVSTRPLAVSALFCIDDFSPETGGTHVLPGSHKVEPFPSEEFVKKHERCMSAKAGSALLFDSMLYHRAGANASKFKRRALNHVYTLPFIKQQISIPEALQGRFSEDPFLRKFLGYESEPGKNVTQWRTAKIDRAVEQSANIPMVRVPVAGPSITQKEIDYVTDAVTNAWYGNANIYHERFEKAFADYLGVRHAISLPSCTSAIHLSLLALGVGPGDEVIVPDATWIASAAPITYVGATPVFADIDERTWCLSAGSFEECITPRTRAAIPVDLYGNMPDMDGILEVAQRHGIAVIEDAAEAAGAEYRGRKAGSFGDTGVFSFHGSKTLTTGEGGMLVTDRDDLYSRVLFLRDHGRQPGDSLFWNTEVAYKYKMSGLQAALGLAQLERLDELIERKREIFNWYRRELSDLPGLTLNPEPPTTRNAFWMITVILDPELGIEKGYLQAQLSARNIDSRPFFHPLSSIPAYRDLPEAKTARERNGVSYRICPYGLNLPSGLNMTEEKVRIVCDVFRSILPS